MQPRGRSKPRFEAYITRVRTIDKPYEYTDIVRRVRASPGHSVNVTARMLGRGCVSLAEMPQTIAHGTKAHLVSMIAKEGLIPGGKRGGRNEVYLAELDPLTIDSQSELPGFRSGSEVLVLVNGRLAAERHNFTNSSTGTFLTEETIWPIFIQASIDIRTRQAFYWNDWQ